MARAMRLVTMTKAVTTTSPFSSAHRLNCDRPGYEVMRFSVASITSSQPRVATATISHTAEGDATLAACAPRSSGRAAARARRPPGAPAASATSSARGAVDQRGGDAEGGDARTCAGQQRGERREYRGDEHRALEGVIEHVRGRRARGARRGARAARAPQSGRPGRRSAARIPRPALGGEVSCSERAPQCALGAVHQAFRSGISWLSRRVI